MVTWMEELATHYEKIRQHAPEDKLMLVFDIDGTILDMRYLMLNVLKAFDKAHNTQFFHELVVEDIRFHENRLEQLLAELGIVLKQQETILDWYVKHRWAPEAIHGSHRPFNGVLEVIRWFQIQPNTYVGLNTGRPESIREETLHALKHLGQDYWVQFSDELLYMNPDGWEPTVQNTKVIGIQHFANLGYRVFAVVDNEPDNLRAIAEVVPEDDILFLHANTIMESRRPQLPPHTVRGKDYDLTDLISEKTLPSNIQFIWHGINDRVNLRQFLASDIQWGECDIHLDLDTDELVLHHDSLDNRQADDENDLTLDELLNLLCVMGKSVKLDLKEGGKLVDKVLELLKNYDFDGSRLWFNSYVDLLHEEGFHKLSSAHPDAILQCPIDFLAPLVGSVPDKTKAIIDGFTTWGINRFSISWQLDDLHQFFGQMNRWGYQVNIYGVSDLEMFLRAVLLMPCSVTADFNFPKWHYYGRGSGQAGYHYEYVIKKNRKQS